MLFSESCTKGQLQVTETTVQVVSPLQRVVWSVPRDSVTYIGLKKGAVMADLTIYTASNHFPANFMAPQKAEQFLTFFPGIPSGPPMAQPQAYVPPIAQNSQWSAPTAPFQVPPQPAKKKPPRWAYIVTGIVALVICGCIGTTVIAAIANPNANTTASTATPTATAAQQIAAATVASTIAPTMQPTATPTPKPTPKPTPSPVPTRIPPTPTPCASPCNPFGYSFAPGSLIYSPNANFCSYFSCIANFWNGRGFVNECQDGNYSKSGGIRGDCSGHGGELRPLYSH